MKRKYDYLHLICFILLLGCSSEDTEYVPLQIQTNPDAVQVYQNSYVDISLFANDANIPETGTLRLTNPNHGSVSILNNNTPNNPKDDIVRFTATGNFTGTDSFVYTICTTNNTCATETVTVTILPPTPVVYNPEALPYPKLSDYNFFKGELKNLEPVSGVVPYDLNSPLFSDYAHKKRFVWMPNGTKATYNSDFTPLDFPVGAFLIKSFYYDNVLPNNATKIIETRLMYFTESGWEFAKYIWNEEQTDATFSNEGAVVNINWSEAGTTKSVDYRVPSRAECFTCHNKFGTPIPIGPKPQNLNKNYTYADGTANQLQKWAESGYLDPNYPGSINSTVAWDDTLEPLELRARSYIDINCAHCHSEESYCEYRPMRFAFNETELDSNLGICVEPDTNIGSAYTHIISPGNPSASVAFFRMSSVEEQYRMPIIGRTLQHTEGVALIEDWINSLTNRCD
ncbi:SO2930 family diheme c-type cytochrome [Bizionia sediminis]|uniref:SO2930 family diheme c-type cytochrome n=1 Tax=Bizionia sediminis TaxID=1737064 RepID=A0ABW5KV76_9FLAO